MALLPDRTRETLVKWLELHPEVEIISRDRASAYSQAAELAAPQAVQVADKFHLLQNLSERVLRVLQRHSRELQAVGIRIDQLEKAKLPSGVVKARASNSVPQAANHLCEVLALSVQTQSLGLQVVKDCTTVRPVQAEIGVTAPTQSEKEKELAESKTPKPDLGQRQLQFEKAKELAEQGYRPSENISAMRGKVIICSKF